MPGRMQSVVRRGRAAARRVGLRAGAAQMDITPPLGIQIAGDIGRRRPAEVVLDPLFAKALVLENAGRKLCVISLDVTVVTREWTNRIRHEVGRFGLEPEAVMVHAVQNHAAPGIGHFMVVGESEYVPPDLWWLRGGDDRYNDFALSRIIEAVRLANDSLEPARVGWGSGIEARVAFNRRFVMRDGSIKTHPRVGDPNILHCEGPMDPELGVMCINNPALRTLAMLLHYTCHPVHGYPMRYITAGWPGAWAEEIRRAYGREVVPLIFNGCCGNIHHRNHLDPTQIDDWRRMGRLLAETTDSVLKGLVWQEQSSLDWRVKRVRIPLRALEASEVEKARQLLAKHPQPMWRDDTRTSIEWDWVYAVALLDLQAQIQKRPEMEYEVQTFRVGDLALVGLGGEPFVEGQLRIKQVSPAKRTYVAHMCNECAGYIPTAEAFRRGGYETRTANWSKLAPEALDRIVEAAIELLRNLFSQGVG